MREERLTRNCHPPMVGLLLGWLVGGCCDVRRRRRDSTHFSNWQTCQGEIHRFTHLGKQIKYLFCNLPTVYLGYFYAIFGNIW